MDCDDKKLPMDQNRVPFEDMIPVEDGYETQAINLNDETQVWDDVGCLGFETQVLNFETQALNFETQVLDNDDECTQLINDSDDDGTDRTEILYEDDELLDDACGGGDESRTLEVKKTECVSHCEETESKPVEQCDGLPDKHQVARSSPRIVTVRSESLGASALAAQSSSPETHRSDSRSLQMASGISEQATHKSSESKAKVQEEVDELHNTSKCEDRMEGSRHENEFKVGSFAARELFPEDMCRWSESFCANGDITTTVGEKEVNQFDNGDNVMAGLSYADSQEPGDFSQANALACIERLIDQSKDLFDNDLNVRNSSRKTPSCNSTMNGPQCLAKKANTIGTDGKPGAFDWDEKHEDGGGGSIFQRRKKEFFYGRPVKKSHTEPRKSKGRQFDACMDDKEKSNNRTAKSVQSDSRLGIDGTDVGEWTTKLADSSINKNLTDDFDEQQDDTDVTADKLKADHEENDMPEMINVGLDTQMAAEAMEFLAYGVENEKCDDEDAHQVLPVQSKHSPRIYSRTKKNVRFEVTTIQAKRSKKILPQSKPSSLLSMKNPSDFQKEHTFVPVSRKRKKSTSDSTSIAQHNRRSSVVSQLKRTRKITNNLGEQKNSGKGVCSVEHRRVRSIGAETSKSVNSRGNSVELYSIQDGKIGTLDSVLTADNLNTIPKRRRSCLSGQKRSQSNAKMGDHTDLRRETKLANGTNDASCLPHAENEVTLSSNKFSTRPSESASTTTPATSTKHTSVVSPVCMGDGYSKLSCKKNLSREINSLHAREYISAPKELRKRRDLATVRVLFSNHLDDGMIKQQQKIADRLRISIASSMTDATHFIADKFVRTRNMLEAIAYGKPVVTPLWLENIGQAKYYIDEERYVLRDMKKEKEFGFNMRASLAHARQHPILQGKKVLITSRAKPSKEIVLSLVKAVHGQPTERVGRSALKDDTATDSLLVLSCEEDLEACIPFLVKGTPVYSSELLLNGIVTQKLEYERYRLFQDHIKGTRSRLTKDDQKLLSEKKDDSKFVYKELILGLARMS